jgi:outer membrane murein-binding lipoprotein Lpp
MRHVRSFIVKCGDVSDAERQAVEARLSESDRQLADLRQASTAAEGMRAERETLVKRVADLEGEVKAKEQDAKAAQDERDKAKQEVHRFPALNPPRFFQLCRCVLPS